MKENIIGRTFKLTAARPEPEKHMPFYRHVGLITKEYALTLFGINPNKVTDVECTILRQDVSVAEHLKSHDRHSTGYFAMYDLEDGKLYFIQPDVQMFDTCFPAGADNSCTDSNGMQKRSIVTLKIEETHKNIK